MNLSHGTTLHGKQWLNPFNRLEPVSYYHRKGPVGQVFSEFSGEEEKNPHCRHRSRHRHHCRLCRTGQEIDFYEIDPAVKMIATNPAYFSFLSDCRADWKIILGDARLTMEKAPPHYYGIIILDAFSSDAIPVHLLTKEAVNLYFSKLTQDGVLLFHISNRYVDLAPVLAKLADENGFAGRSAMMRKMMKSERMAPPGCCLPGRRRTSAIFPEKRLEENRISKKGQGLDGRFFQHSFRLQVVTASGGDSHLLREQPGRNLRVGPGLDGKRSPPIGIDGNRPFV